MHLLLVAHIGAGNHSTRYDAHFRTLLRSAVNSDTLADASRVIEHSVSTNTAKGSSLDLQGHASSDCNVIEVDSWKVNSQCTIINIQDQRLPTQFTQAMSSWLDEQYGAGTISKELGLSRPIVLEYRTIKEFFQSRADLEDSEMSQWFSSTDDLVSKKAVKDFETFKGYMHKIKGGTEQGLKNKHAIEQSLLPHVQDTVGLVYLNTKPGGAISLATSSGGNFYKLPGRISCAGISGSGIAYGNYEDIETCCMCSGNGDDIIQMNLASYLCDSIAEEIANSEILPDLGNCLVERVIRRGRRQVLSGDDGQNSPVLYLGVILIVRSKSGSRLVYCHSTETFYFGFRNNGSTEVVLSQNDGEKGRFLHGEYKLC